MEIERLFKESREYEKAKKLYDSAFPDNEKGVFENMFLDEVVSQKYVFYENGVFCGFVCLFVYLDIAHIIYLAVDDSLRGKGYGTKMLKNIAEMYAEYRIVADLERPDEDSYNYEHRLRRRAFYVRNGYEKTEISYEWQGENYDIYAYNGMVSKKEFRDFWDYIDEVKEGALRGF